MYLSIRLSSVIFYSLVAETADKLKRGTYVQVMSCFSCSTHLCIVSGASWGCTGGKACFPPFFAVLENTEAQCLALKLWCHLRVGGDLQLGRAKGMMKALTSHCFPDTPAAPLCRFAMDFFLAFSYWAACLVHILTTNHVFAGGREGKNMLAVDVFSSLSTIFFIKAV